MSFIILDAISFEPESKLLFSYFSVAPTTQRKKIINKLIKKLIADGNWSTLDALWVMASHSQQGALINWKNPGSNTLTEVNAPAWVVNKGYTSDGASYLNTNFNPATDGLNYTKNSASLHIYSRTDINEAKYDFGNNSSGAVRSHLLTRNSGNTILSSLNTTGATTIASLNSLGFFSSQRTSSTLTTAYRNGSSIGTTADVSADVASLNFFINALNSNGTAAGFSTKQLSMAAVGGGAITHSTFNDAIEAYMDRLGTGVQ